MKVGCMMEGEDCWGRPLARVWVNHSCFVAIAKERGRLCVGFLSGFGGVV